MIKCKHLPTYSHKSVTLTSELRCIGWLWRVSRPRPSRCDILSGSSSRTHLDTPGPAPDDIPLEAPPTLPGIQGEVRRRHQGGPRVLPAYSWQRNLHVFVLNDLQTTVQQWDHCGREWRKSAEVRAASLVPGRLGGGDELLFSSYFEHFHQSVTGNCWHVEASLMSNWWLDPVQRTIDWSCSATPGRLRVIKHENSFVFVELHHDFQFLKRLQTIMTGVHRLNNLWSSFLGKLYTNLNLGSEL